MMNFLNKIRFGYRALPDKKQHIEFFTALLTIPVLLTVILVNISNLNAKDTEKESQPTPAPTTTTPAQIQAKNSTTPVTTSPSLSPTLVECKKEVGPVEITTPQEGKTVSDDPFTIHIAYPKLGEYCAVVWAYRINGGSWSEYSDTAISVYNLPPGDKKLEVKVKSIVSIQEKILERNFTYKNSVTPSPSPTQSVTPTP